MESKVSVIIPIYNVEQYLAQCLDSVINQTYKNLEIICVNDCSPDNSAKILQEYALKDNRIKIVNREKNGGLSAARNSGLDVATGEYVYFIDSDDWIDLDYIEKMVEAIELSNVDVVLNTNILVHKEGERSVQFMPYNTQNNVSDCLLAASTCVWNMIWNTWAHIWKKSFLDKIGARFPEGYIIEDMYFQAVTFVHISKIYVTRASSYHYLVRNNSIMGAFTNSNLKYCYALLRIFNKTFDYLKEHDLLNTNKINLFTIINLQGTLEEKKVFISELRKYFLKIKKYVEENNEIYNNIELSYFNDIINDEKTAFEANYYKKYIFHKLREGILNRGTKCEAR